MWTTHCELGSAWAQKLAKAWSAISTMKKGDNSIQLVWMLYRHSLKDMRR